MPGYRHRLTVCCSVAAAMLLGLATHMSAAATAFRIDRAERVVAFGDVHGAYRELVSLLQSAGLLDGQLAWKGGTTHLVSVGDLLDRGADSRKVLDLLMRLETEARAAGGAVHVVAGNHEIMNVLGDFSYTSPGEYAAFAAEEDVELRAQQLEAFLAFPEHADLPRAELERRFATEFPPGWFAHRQAFSSRGRYGQWILELPALLVIGDTVFVHGGLPRTLAGNTLDEANARYRSAVSNYLTALEALEAGGVVDAYRDFHERPQRVRAWLDAPPANIARDPGLVSAAQSFLEADKATMLGVDGPLWYRGEAICHTATEADHLRAALRSLGVSRAVIGHTPTPTSGLLSRFGGRIIRIDTGMNYEVYQGRRAALVIAGDELGAFYADSPTSLSTIDAQPGYAGYSRLGLEEARVLEILATGSISDQEPGGANSVGLTLEQDGRRLPAVFVRDTAERVDREIAAWRLDRLLDLGLVPPTVAREIDGKRGYVQLRLRGVESYASLQASERRLAVGWCPMEPQNQLMYAFDALTFNQQRTPESVLYDTEEWMLMSTLHGAAFGTARQQPRHLANVTLVLPDELLERIGRLTPGSLETALGGLLSKRELRALLERARMLVKSAGPAGAAP